MKTNKKYVLYGVIACSFAIGCAEIIEKDLEGKKVVVSAPSDNVRSDTSAVLFLWQPLDGAAGYELQIAHPAFDSIVSITADTNLTNTFIRLPLPSGSFQWRVRAYNNSSSSEYSDIRHMIIP